MLVTINTDASCYMKVGTYAFWAICDEGRFTGQGVLKGEIIGSTYAEMKAIGNAIFAVTNIWETKKPIKRILINSDCLPAIHLLSNRNTGSKAKIKKLRNEVLKIMDSTDIKFIFRHVKAHTNGETRRRYVNNWCDKTAKSLLRKQLTKSRSQL